MSQSNVLICQICLLIRVRARHGYVYERRQAKFNKISVKSRSFDRNQTLKVKLADFIVLNLFMRCNEKCNISHAS